MPKYLDDAGVQRLVIKILELLESKVDKENGKGLSTEDFTSTLKDKLENLGTYDENILTQTNEAATRASQAATLAGNFAAQAIQAKTAIDQKMWYGTMEEYNALETVNNSTIYIILHE